MHCIADKEQIGKGDYKPRRLVNTANMDTRPHSCDLCDCISFMQFRDGKVILYGSSHPPADLYGRYEAKADGSVNVFRSPYKEGEPEELIYTATPRLWFTRFRSPTSTSGGWYRKAPVYGTVRTTIRDQEVSSLMIKKDRTVVKTFYDSALAELRTETKQPKTKEAEQAVTH
mgnify:CR=1 FL=1